MSSVGIKITETGNTDNLLAKMPIEFREKQLKSALKKGANVVASATRRNAPKPGYPFDDPEKKPLKNTISTVTRQYGPKVMTITGPRWPDGAHGRLIEFGFLQKTVRLPNGVIVRRKTPLRVVPNPFMRRAADTTKSQQESAIVGSLRKGVADLGA